MAVQFWLGWNLSRIGRSLAPAALGVAGAGIGLGMLGSLGFARLERRRNAGSPVTVMLWFGAVVLTFLGFFWTLSAPVGALWLGAIAVAVSLVLLVSHVVGTKRLDTRALGTWSRSVLAICAVTVALAGCAAFVPSALTLRFRWQDEAQLDRLVHVVASQAAPVRCTAPYARVKVPVFGIVTELCSGTYAEFDANDYSFVLAPGLTIGTAGQDFGEGCLLHLDGPWWEQGPGGGGVSCPYGFTFIPGG
jgi:hypothetical protein